MKQIRTEYDNLLKAKNRLLAEYYQNRFGEPSIISAAQLTGCSGEMTDNGIVVLTINETLPHLKHELSGVTKDHWQSCVHAAVHDLARKTNVPKFGKAIVGIHVFVPTSVPHPGRTWDTSNRAVNLIINNLKGIFFPDDDIEHMMFAAAGTWSDKQKTVIYVGDCRQNSRGVLELLGYAQ